ncbi:MAG TPA: helicase-exonuclease AddAB subunit AddA [Bacillota bacterium]|nr:helicase-exonuclease AddAB subunit AddA [Bacillota bacterium]HOK64447.1 helicase-exonuclease AddAB subunit AddA [Bacillota bacterium]HOL11733.1 helicase-exonuclease AddAB subunit AddA [Bacillota bacterium]HOQ02353.1 helicase-exonuclease AddAB subunit AddA [Bacillota bacterium]HPP60782.1 helicase-exonuclease AddAB subunit AddA [Bacillota bacterium]
MSSENLDKKWTAEQSLAIDVYGKNMLVSAAAGTGKTAVLVERIIRRVLSHDEPSDIERLLVVTFTEKAAVEMKERIGEALQKARKENPLDARIHRQISLLERAQISTIHSFCLSIVKRYFYLVDLEPSFRVLDSKEAELLRIEALDEVFEQQYHHGTGNYQLFADLVDMYGGRGTDEDLKDTVLRLYDFSRTQPSAEEWLEEAYSLYEMVDNLIAGTESLDHLLSTQDLDIALAGLPWTEVLFEGLLTDLDDVLLYAEEAEKLCYLNNGPQHYLPVISEEVGFFTRLRDKVQEYKRDRHDVLISIRKMVQGFKFSDLPGKRTDEVDPELLDRTKECRNRYKKGFERIKSNVIMRPSFDLMSEIQKQTPYVRCLVDIVYELDERYREKKKARGGVDFSDLEVYCLKILKHEDPNLAAEIQDAYDYVFVDEYQDTNPIQEAIISLVSKGDNLFMVGDIKQSIYRFRLAEPKIFLEKYELFEPVDQKGNFDPDALGVKVDLSNNFRSRKEVIDAVNYVFENIMKKSVAEIDYTAENRLNLGAWYPEISEPDLLIAEILLVEREEQAKETLLQGGNEGLEEGDESLEEYEALEKEALVIASKIKELVDPTDPFQVWDPEQGCFRDCTYKDIAILMRSTRDRANVMIDIFQKCGIPVYSELGTGYFRAREVEVALSILSVMDNPKQDIPLASVLRSPVVGLSPRDITIIRVFNQDGDLYESLKSFALLHKDSDPYILDQCQALDLDALEVLELSRVVFEFLEQLEIWRTMFRRRPLAHALWAVLKETGYYDYVGGLPGGAQRQANLRALVDRAMEFDSFGRHGLFRFLRFIERIQETEGDLGTARALGENEDVVEILSVHKSKGLEFPVVFVADLGKMFNTENLRHDILFHKDLGIGAMFCDLDTRIKYPTAAHQANYIQIKKDDLAEEMRILYVAMTRAKEKLYLVGSAKDLEKKFEKWKRLDLLGAETYLDWVCPPVLKGLGSKDIPFRVDLIGVEGGIPVPEPFASGGSVSSRQWHEVTNLLSPSWPVDPLVYSEVQRRLEWEYRYRPLTVTPAKMSVGELKSRLDLQDETWRLFPSPDKRLVPSEGKIPSGVERGIAVHALLARMDLSKGRNQDQIAEEVHRLAGMGYLEREHILAEDIARLWRFFQSPLGKIMTSLPNNVRRETPFTMRLDVKLMEDRSNAGSVVMPVFDLDSNLYCMDSCGRSDYIVVQGIIDVLINDGESLTILDYKTDSITMAELDRTLETYTPQVALYCYAAEMIFGLPVASGFIYFLTLEELVEIDWRNYLNSVSGFKNI